MHRRRWGWIFRMVRWVRSRSIYLPLLYSPVWGIFLRFVLTILLAAIATRVPAACICIYLVFDETRPGFVIVIVASASARARLRHGQCYVQALTLWIT